MGVLLGATVLIASRAAESPYACAAGHYGAGCYGLHGGDFDGRFNNHQMPVRLIERLSEKRHFGCELTLQQRKFAFGA